MTPALTRIDHVHVHVSNLVAAEEWYGRVLGFSRSPELAFWAVGGGPLTVADASNAIHLALFEQAARPCRSTIAFSASADGFLAWREHLESALGRPVDVVDHQVAWSLYFSDPDANPFEITSYDHAKVRAQRSGDGAASPAESGPWEERLAALWALLPELEPALFRSRIETLVGERPQRDAIALFELGCSQDSTGRSDLAVPLYRAALAAGLTDVRRRRATIQLASSLRNIGQAEQAESLLAREKQQPDDQLGSAVAAFHALALLDLGREREAVGRALLALSPHLMRYNASLGRYARELLQGGENGGTDH